jgi:hypothetical protein
MAWQKILHCHEFRESCDLMGDNGHKSPLSFPADTADVESGNLSLRVCTQWVVHRPETKTPFQYKSHPNRNASTNCSEAALLSSRSVISGAECLWGALSLHVKPAHVCMRYINPCPTVADTQVPCPRSSHFSSPLLLWVGLFCVTYAGIPEHVPSLYASHLCAQQ